MREAPVTNWLAAIVIGVVVAAIAYFVLGRLSARARWLAPLLAIVGALIGGILGAAFGHAGYGWKRATLTVVLALAGAGAAWLLERGNVSSGSSRRVAS
jgi:uncharacterized membrane protein YeaQ/YmgE (transglycosylase-associated protein family)